MLGPYKEAINFSSWQLYNPLVGVVLQNIQNFAKEICSPYLSLYQSLDT